MVESPAVNIYSTAGACIIRINDSNLRPTVNIYSTAGALPLHVPHVAVLSSIYASIISQSTDGVTVPACGIYNHRGAVKINIRINKDNHSACLRKI